MSERIEATERLIATLIAGQARVRHIAHSRLSFPAALSIEMHAQTGLAERWSVTAAVAALHDDAPHPPQKHPRIAPSVQAWTEDLGSDDLVSEPVRTAEEAELAADFGEQEHPAAEEETSEAEVEPVAARGRGISFTEDDSDEELVQRVEVHEDEDSSAPSDEESDDPDTEEVEDDESGEPAAASRAAGDEEGHTFVPPTLDAGVPSYWERSSHGESEELSDDDATALHPPGEHEDEAHDEGKSAASSTFPPPADALEDDDDDLAVEDLRTGEVEDDLAAEDLRTGEVVDDIDPDALEEDDLELDEESAEVELDDSEVAADEAHRAVRTEPGSRQGRVTTPPPVNEWEEEDRTMLSGSHNEWDGEERTVLHGSEMANVLEEEDAVPGPPTRSGTTPSFIEDEDDSDSVGDMLDDDVDEDSGTGTGAAAVRILGVGKAEPVASKKKRSAGEDADDEPGTEEGIVAAGGAEEGDDWGAGLAGGSGGLSVLGKRKTDAELPSILKLTEEESDEVGGAASDGAVVDLDGGSLQEVEEVDPAQLRSFQRAAEDAVSKGDMHQAILHYRDMLDLAPENLDAYLGRGRCLVHLGDYAAAMSDFQRSEDLDPKSPLPLVEMGNLFFARKEYLRAIQFFDTALELDDKNAWAWCYRGICHHYRKKHKEAFQDLQKAYSLDPEIPNIRRYVQMAVKAMEKSTDGA
jgi:Flp pilus assembly protein TadD